MRKRKMKHRNSVISNRRGSRITSNFCFILVVLFFTRRINARIVNNNNKDISSSLQFLRQETTPVVNNTNNGNHQQRNIINAVNSNNRYKLNNSIEKLQNDVNKIQSITTTDLTKAESVTCDTSYIKAWTIADWDRHCSPSLIRFIRHISSWPKSKTALHILPTVCTVVLWCWTVTKLAATFPTHLTNMKFGITMTFLQAPILLLLTLKTNRALDRFLEARRAWGVVSRATRSLAGLICTYIMPLSPDVGLCMCRYLTIFAWSLKGSLRGENDDDVIRTALLEKEAEWLLSAQGSRPLLILYRIRFLCSMFAQFSLDGDIDCEGEGMSAGYSGESGTSSNDGVDDYGKGQSRLKTIPSTILLTMNERLYDLETSVGICNRILASPIPPTFTRHISRILCLYLGLLPLALVGMGACTSAMIMTSIFATYVLVGIDEIGIEIECPFHIMPIHSLATSLQKDVVNQIVVTNSMPQLAHI